MDRMKTKFIIAVTTRLAAAEDSNAKTDLIEELSENLYQRYLDLVAAGETEDTAYTKALEDLGDVDELLAYLGSLGPDGELPREESQGRDYFNEFLRGAEEVVRETISQTKEAVDQAKVIFRDVAEKLKEKYPNGFDGSFHVHFNDNDDDHGEHPADEDHEGEARQDSGRDWVVSAGYSKERGFFCERGQSQPVTGTVFSSQDIKGVDIKLYNGDVAIHLLDDPQADLTLDGDTDQLELRLSSEGILSIRQGKTASASFFFARGLASADVKLYLPRRLWTFLQVTSVNGDITIDSGLETDQLIIKTASGDLEAEALCCRQMIFKSASGDLRADGRWEKLWAESISGDIDLSGRAEQLQVSTASGDVQFSGALQAVKTDSASGDVILTCHTLPEQAQVQSKSGDVELSIPDEAGFSLQYSVVSGDMESEFPLIGAVGGKSGNAVYLDGGRSTFHLSTVSGDIALRKI